MNQDSDKEIDILIVYSDIEIEVTDDPPLGIIPSYMDRPEIL